MKAGAQIVVSSALRSYAPLLLLFALSVLVVRAPGAGIGFVAGVVFALALALHALIFGAQAFCAAFPPMWARVLVGGGVVAAAAGAGAPGWMYAPQAIEAGLFVATAASAALIVAVLFGRAAMLRDAEW
jgi:multisubunit Na+/H+ antiporter MnhB subunit